MSLGQLIVSKAKILGSSQNPEEMSMTIKGVLLALIPVALVLWPNGSEQALQNVINAGFAVVSAVIVFWGVIRKFKK